MTSSCLSRSSQRQAEKRESGSQILNGIYEYVLCVLFYTSVQLRDDIRQFLFSHLHWLGGVAGNLDGVVRRSHNFLGPRILRKMIGIMVI